MNKWIMFSILILFSACSSREKKAEVQQEIKEEKVTSRKDLSQNIKAYISSSNKLNEKQKESLTALHEKTSSELQSTNEQITQIKMVMVKHLMEPKIDRKKMSILRKDLRKLEKKRMELSLSSLDKAQQIIAPIQDNDTRQRLYESFMMREGRYY